jgi:hypothetical protein
MRRLLIAALALCVGVGLLTSAALAAKVKSKVEVENTGYGEYEGKVKSPLKRCQKNRVVTLWHDTNGNGEIDRPPGPPPPDFKIGSTTTDENGNWVLRNQEQPPQSQPGLIAELKPNSRCRGDEATATAKPFPFED